MREKKILLGFYNYTVVLTYIGMLVGFAGIMQAMEGKFHCALVCLMGNTDSLCFLIGNAKT